MRFERMLPHQIRHAIADNTPVALALGVMAKTITGKTNVAFKFNITINIPEAQRSTDGYKFSVEKTSDDSDSSSKQGTVRITGWDEIENSAQAYPRTAHIGYALKALDEHTQGVPTFTSLVKGLIVNCDGDTCSDHEGLQNCSWFC